MSKDDLTVLLSQLDQATRQRWEETFQQVEDEIAAHGPAAARAHLDAALTHLLAVGWTLRRCFDDDTADAVLRPLGDAAETVEQLRSSLAALARQPEWWH
ncbi:MAG: hypothetical protein EXR73_03045 [Myxococcales bacterium]|nr:hypothetical protein [Myxococcales bacterium]